LLLLHVLDRDRTWLYAHPEAQLSAAESEHFFALIARRANGEPTQHLTGKQEFWGLEFEVTPDVLIPALKPNTSSKSRSTASPSANSAPGANKLSPAQACKSPISAPAPAASPSPWQEISPPLPFMPPTFLPQPWPWRNATLTAIPSPVTSILSNAIYWTLQRRNST